MQALYKKLIFITLSLIVFPTTLCLSASVSDQKVPAKGAENLFQSVTPQEAQTLLGNHKDIVLVDVRTPQELQEGKIEGSRLIPFYNILKGDYTLPKDNPLMIYCAVGGRSFVAGKILSKNGYHTIYNIKGGLAAWKKAGLPLARQPQPALQPAQ